jgi:tetratricopeptide (TPR) repeat protein
MSRLTRFLFVLLLAMITGCSQMETLRIGQDRPEDLEPLIKEHEYARARQLTGKYPSLDTVEVQTWITSQESEYEATVFTDARALEKNNDLLGAVQLLSGALQKIPHSTLLRELRSSIEQQRVGQLRINEREQLTSRATYMLEQQKLYQDQINLESPSLGQRWENKRNAKEARELSAKLLEHGQHAMQTDKLDIAVSCLELSSALNQSPEADALLSEIRTIKNSRKQVAKKQATIKKKKNQQKVKRKQTNRTRVLMEEAQQALSDDDLQVARAAFVQIPPSAQQRKEVIAIQDDLDRAVSTRVDELITAGDTQYRADNVLEAIRTWTKGLSLDPENPELRERVERANRVLARLEELKRQQGM